MFWPKLTCVPTAMTSREGWDTQMLARASRILIPRAWLADAVGDEGPRELLGREVSAAFGGTAVVNCGGTKGELPHQA